MFVFPVVPDAALPPEFERFAVVPEALPRSRPRRSRRTARSGSTSDAHRFAERTRMASAQLRRPPRVPRRLLFVFPLAAILERGLSGDGDGDAVDVLADPWTREVVCPRSAAAASTTLTIAIALPAAYVLGRFTSRERPRAGARRGAVRPAHGGRRIAFLAVLPDGLERLGGDPRRARILQRRRRRPGRRHLLGRDSTRA